MEERIVPSYHNFRLAPTSTQATLCIEDAAPIPLNRLLHGIDTANNVWAVITDREELLWFATTGFA
jgi:hypothetical protein